MGMFDKAAVVNKPKAPKSTKAEVTIPGLKTHAEIDALIKALNTLRGTLDVEIKDTAFEHFVELGSEKGIRPENFRGVDGDASASIELRKRSTASVLSSEERAMFDKFGVPYEEMVGTEKMFGINPVYSENTDLLGKVEAALTGIVPDDFIVVQEKRSKYVVSDDSLNTVFKKLVSNPEMSVLVKATTVMAIKPKLAVTDIATIMDNVKAMIAATPAVAAPATKKIA